MKAHPGNNAPTTDLPRATRRKTQRKLITISVPVYNEEENIPALHAALSELAERENGYDFEFLFTDNASTDRTFELLCERAREDDRIRVLRFSRNFGFQKSILTNYLNANGAAAVQIDADLQDPPRVISDFLRLWEQGYKVVYGIRRRRQENPVLNLSRRAFYAVITNLSQTPVPRDAGDFRLIDRVIIENLRGIDEQTPYL
ncbi:MAG: glycosyltransferase family 2 protein, partial [Nitratireductor sp.]